MNDGLKTTKLEQQNVQVQIRSGNNSKPKYFNVPKNQADAFTTEYKKNTKKNSIIVNTTFVSSIFGAVIIANRATKKLSNSVLKWIIGCAAGIAGATISIIGTSNYIDNKNNKILQKYNAQEINYNA